MARGFSRGGSSRTDGSRSGSANRSQGQIRQSKVVQYAIKGKDGGTKYIGSTNNPTRRTAEHRETGKLKQGDRLEVQSRPVSRGKAEQLEAGRLKDTDKNTGVTHNGTQLTTGSTIRTR